MINILLSTRSLRLHGYLAQIQQLKDGFGLALAVLFMFGFKDKAFVGEVLREMNRKNRQILTSPQVGAGPKVAA